MLAVKRGIDLIVAMLLLLVLLPLLAVIAMAVRVESGSPVIFRCRRIGHRGRPFTMFKFRTMLDASDGVLQELLIRNPAEGMVKIADDPRVTPIGRVLRRFSLDELPQLCNVIRGDMSLVGPRPHEVGEITLDHPAFRARLVMRPGLTGLWQIKARTSPSLALRVRFDLEYIATWTPWLDVTILLKTIPVVARGEGGQVADDGRSGISRAEAHLARRTR